MSTDPNEQDQQSAFSEMLSQEPDPTPATRVIPEGIPEGGMPGDTREDAEVMKRLEKPEVLRAGHREPGEQGNRADEGSVVTLAITDEKLQLVIRDAELEPASAQELLSNFAPLVSEAKGLVDTARTINVTAEDQTAKMKLARSTRLALREIRIKGENLRKKLKTDSLRRGKAIDGIYHVLEYVIAPLEDHLKEQEEFALRRQQERNLALRTERKAAIDAAFPNFPQPVALEDLSGPDFQILVDAARNHAIQEATAFKEAEDKKKLRADRTGELQKYGLDAASLTLPNGDIAEISAARYREILTAQKAWFEKEEKKKADAEAERTRQEEENKRRREKAEADAATARADAQKARLGKVAAERKTQEALTKQRKAEADLKAQRDRQAEADRQAKFAAAKLARAPDKAKLIGWVRAIAEIRAPDLKSEGGAQVKDAILDLRESFILEANGKILEL